MRATTTALTRSRWAAAGAALAITLGCGGLMTASADVSSGERSAFVPIAPCRVIDTRPAPDTVGPRTSPLGPGEALAVTIRGSNGACTIPADAIGVNVNLAAISPTADSFLTLYPTDAARPLAANLNVIGGQAPVSNAATVRLGADGALAVYNLAGSVHVAIDITGYYVGHDHDDRYYTKDQTYTRAETDTKVAGVLTPGVITNAMLAPNAVTGDKVADNSIGSADVAPLHGDIDIIDNSITTFDLADNSVDSDEVLDFGLSNEDIGVLFAQVNADGTLANASAITVTSTRLGTGQFQVDFGRNISACAFVATIGPYNAGAAAGEIDVADRSGNVEAVFVRTHNSAGTLTDEPFQLAVVC